MSKNKRKTSNLNSKISQIKRPQLLIVAIVFGLVGVTLLVRSFAANTSVSVPLESAQITGDVTVIPDSSASTGNYYRFGGEVVEPPPPSGNFAGKMTMDGVGYGGVIVKAFNIWTPGWPADYMGLNGNDCGTFFPPDCYTTTTDAQGNWSASVTSGYQYMLKIYPPSLCAANAISNPAYTTNDSGYISSDFFPFLSPPSSPSGLTYLIMGNGRFLYDLPIHIHPDAAYAPYALNGSQTYTDLNVDFFTRSGGFSTTNGFQSC